MKIPPVKHSVIVKSTSNGKGSARRAGEVSEEEFADNWRTIFGEHKSCPGHTRIVGTGANKVEIRNPSTAV